jgi:hypothetical protein
MNKKNHAKKNPEVNLIVSPTNHTFLILDLQIEPQAFRHTHCTLKEKKINLKKGPIQGSICFKLVLGLLVLVPLSKMASRIFVGHIMI